MSGWGSSTVGLRFAQALNSHVTECDGAPVYKELDGEERARRMQHGMAESSLKPSQYTTNHLNVACRESIDCLHYRGYCTWSDAAGA